ncbi:MAG TPA: hypothetical protein VNO55_32010, partial [Polyangia bacterium]|nr:hypothetical protein [Polyangia bacterium]
MRIRGALSYLPGVASILIAGVACAAPGLPEARLALRDRGADYQMEVLVDGVPAPTFHQGGETFVMGQLGQRYTLRIHNNSPRRIEAVVSVDGRDAVDGKSADYRSKRGYLVPAWGQVDIDGWRLSRWQAAAFRFSAVEDSYAARVGAPRDVGVIGAAIFTERYVPPPPPPRILELPAPRADREDDYGAPENLRSSDKKATASRSSNKSTAAGAPLPSAAPPADRAPQSRSGLGTEFGEAVASSIQEVAFVRASAYRPTTILGIRYNDRAGLLAMGIDVDGVSCGYPGCEPEVALRRSARPFPVVDRRFA